MNAATILHTFFEKSSFDAIKDKRRLKAVLDCTQALCQKETLTLTGLGRAMLETETKVKHSIKRVCRLLSNPFLYRERRGVYGFISAALLKNLQYPIIIIDWSPVNHTDKQILRATIPIGGRAFTLYEEVHPESKLGTLPVHKAFIRRLAAFVPEGVRPIVTTDAGFKVPWFKPVEQQGWYWLGRARGNTKIYVDGQWLTTKQLFSQATTKAQHLGLGNLTRSNSIPCQVILYRKKYKGRQDRNLKGDRRQCGPSRDYAKGQREPWLLVTNLPKDEWFAERVVALYTQRMQIEEGFRDTKNERYGFALNYCGSRCTKRVEILLMIAMLTQFALILIGKAAYMKGYYKDFQANTIRIRRVLSYFFLGKEICGRRAYSFKVTDILRAFAGLKAHCGAEFR